MATPCGNFRYHILHIIDNRWLARRKNWMFRHVHCTVPLIPLGYFTKEVILSWVNTLRPRQNGRHFPDDIFQCIFLNENIWTSIKISLKFVPKGSINTLPALVQVMAWRRLGDKPLSEAMMVNLPTHICVTRPQWINSPLKFTGGST